MSTPNRTLAFLTLCTATFSAVFCSALSYAESFAQNNAQSATKSLATVAIEQLRNQQIPLTYQRYSVTEQGSMLEQFDPASEPQWQLLEENGHTPSRARLEEYRHIKQREQHAQVVENNDESFDQQGVSLKLTDLVALETIESLGMKVWRGEPAAVYQFKPQLNKFSDNNDKLIGHLYLKPETGRPMALQVTLAEAFSPAFSVTLKAFTLTIEWQQIELAGQVYSVPLKTSEQVAGDYLFWVAFDESTTRQFSHYQLVDSASLSN